MRSLGELPHSMFQDICALLHVRSIRNVPPFKECEEPFIMELVTRLRTSIYMAGEMIFRGGDVGHEMYLISKGKVGGARGLASLAFAPFLALPPLDCDRNQRSVAC